MATTRKTLCGKEIFAGADHPKAPTGREQARLRLHGARGGQGSGHQRGHLPPEGVVEILERLFTERGEPAYIRSDNGPEFIAEAIKRRLAASGVKTLYIELGSPWENAYSETFISRLRDELLDRGCLPI
jgi:transposase InsO family protein